jgi:hypothetical protein
MSEWGIPFHAIEDNWTQSQFNLMCARLTERVEQQRRAMERGRKPGVQTMRYADAIKQGLF